MHRFRGKAVGELPIKRCWLEGIEEIYDCPNCKHRQIEPLNGDRLNYPIINSWFERGMYCMECEHEWSVDFRLNISVEIKEKEPPQEVE